MRTASTPPPAIRSPDGCESLAGAAPSWRGSAKVRQQRGRGTTVQDGLITDLHGILIDHIPQLLESSYRLRYQVYCLERGFLRSEDYPLGLEKDEFDCISSHIGAVDAHGELAGTARMVNNTAAGFPLLRHCTIFPHEKSRDTATDRLLEVGRLSVSRHFRRRRSDGALIIGDASNSRRSPEYHGADRRTARGDVLLTLLEAAYHHTKRIGATQWLAATEPSLQRVLARHGLPFRQIGPESDYFGLVAPYRMDVEEFDQVIRSGRFPELEGFATGPEPGFEPQPTGNRAQAGAAADPVEQTASSQLTGGHRRGA
jgi:N-acyl amino acid synthase of PEP-CTERM/exosortase system